MSDNFAQLVKQQADIVKIIGEYIKLRKTGAKNYTGLCPFHKEKSPSFSVNATHQYYYCFGCHEKGDVFNFVMKLDSLTFPESIRAVATKAGIPLPKRDFNSPEESRDASLRRDLIAIHEAATQYFEAQLKSPSAARAREYLTNRGVTSETIAKFRIGFAPDDFNDMRERLKPHFDEEVLRASGLFSSKESPDGSPQPLYARFRKRITVPLANEQGKTIAFTARALDAVDDKGRDIAKYINSPETPLYTKGQILFNLDKAKAAIRASDFAVLVEGQMDCISVFMAGVHNIIATSGTAFTETQVRLLSRFTRNVIVNFDPDAAGALAAEKSIALLTEEDFVVKIVTLSGPQGEQQAGLDPDRFVREQGLPAYLDALRNARRHSDYLIDRARQLFPGRTADAKVKQLNFLLPHIRRMPNRIQRDEFAADAAQKLGIDSAILRLELKQAAAQRTESVRAHSAEPASEIERVLLRALVLPEHDSPRILAAELLSQHPQWFDSLPSAALLESLAHAPAPSNPLDAAPDEPSRVLLARALESSSSDEPVTTQQVDDALHTLAQRHLQRRQRELRTLIAEADRRGDHDMLRKLTQEKLEIDRKLREH